MGCRHGLSSGRIETEMREHLMPELRQMRVAAMPRVRENDNRFVLRSKKLEIFSLWFDP
jgi:hypothetical protein